MKVYGEYFYGNKISEYGLQNGYVDYRTLAKAFDAVMNNDIISKTAEIGYWEPVGGGDEYREDLNGNIYTPEEAAEKIDELREELDALTDAITDESSEEEDAKDLERSRELEEEIESLEDSRYYEVFQWFIVSDQGAEILEEAGEIVYYNDALDMYVWGVTHWGTSWDYVLTNIRCNCGDEE